MPESLRDIRVLVVDDNKTSREFLKDLLNRFSLDVTTVDSGKAALEELRKTEENDTYRLVLMDWLMPEMDGLEAIKQIRNDTHLKRVPTIIMVTAYNLDEVMNRVKKEKVDAFLFKPVDQTLLLDTIKEVLGYETEKGKEKKSLSQPVHQADVLGHIRWSRVLVVEDNPTNQQVVRELLESAGVIVKVANNGQEAIRTLSEFDFDVVLMDVQMPEMDGYETTRLLRQEPVYANLPIIALTAHALEREQKKCFDAGMNDYLAKPINADQLYSILSKWTKNKEEPPLDAELETDIFQNGNGEWLLSESVPWIDIPAAAAKLRGNRGLLKKLIMEFPRDYSDYARLIGEAMQKGEKENAYRLAHTIKGIAGQIAANDLQKAAEKMEETMEKGDPEDFDSFLKRFETALQNVLESIANIKTDEENRHPGDSAIPPENKVCDLSEVISFFIDLSLLLEENDLNAEDYFISRKNCLNGFKIDNKVEKLEDSIGRLDYSRALDCIAEISQTLNISI